jgi:phosphatidylserine/phosphatidylglycerophosphate/cardiolipin synthase-like enzyme
MVLVGLLLGVGGGMPAVARAAPGPQVYPIFNYPQVGTPDPSITTELVRLLNQVPTGAQVIASFFVIEPDYPVVDALIAAHDRGASVRVVLDSGDGQLPDTNQAMDATYERLGVALGKDTSAPSFAMQCVLACISKEVDSINHNKFVAMSASGDLSDVVFQSTGNMRREGSGDTAWNAAVVSSGDAGLYADYRGYFDDLASRRTVPGNDYNAVRPPTPHGKFTPYFFPRTDDVDSVSQTLMSVDCAVQPTTVNVMASYFTRLKVRNRLNEMAQAGCGVRVIARADHITRELCDSLLPPVQVAIADPPSVSRVGTHGKYLTISGGFDGVNNRHLVWMGSHNLTRDALVRNDETFLLVDDQSVHNAFVTNFDSIWTYPTVTSGCGRAGTETDPETTPEPEPAPSPTAGPTTPSPSVKPSPKPSTTPQVNRTQSVKRGLPRKLAKKRTELLSTHTVQGRRLTTVAMCKVAGSGQTLKKRKACVIKKPRSGPVLVLDTGKKLRVRLIQSAKGSAALLAFTRVKDYTYRPTRTGRR